MSVALRPFAAGLALLALWAGARTAEAGSLEPVAKFFVGAEHLDLEVYRASDGGKMGLLTIENPLRIRGQPSASIALQPGQWPQLIALWTQARAGVTGAEPWQPTGDITEIDGSVLPARLSVSTGPNVRFALGAAGGGFTFDLAPTDVEAMEQALQREKAILESRK